MAINSINTSLLVALFLLNFCEFSRSAPVEKDTAKATFNISIIADLDSQSVLIPQLLFKYQSYIKHGSLVRTGDQFKVTWTDDDAKPVQIITQYNIGGRGNELSELLEFSGKILTFDDRTGIVFEIENGKSLVPWLILSDGAGNATKGFKSEWATVKDDYLYVGSTGREVLNTDTLEVINKDLCYVKRISKTGEVEHLNWQANYDALRKGIHYDHPGYIWHEAVTWSDVHQKWVFLPRKCGKEKFDFLAAEKKGCNKIIFASDDFSQVSHVDIITNDEDEETSPKGFSSFKFLPGSNDSIIVGLKTIEFGDDTTSFITVIGIDGTVMLPDQEIVKSKYEGLDFGWV